MAGKEHNKWLRVLEEKSFGKECQENKTKQMNMSLKGEELYKGWLFAYVGSTYGNTKKGIKNVIQTPWLVWIMIPLGMLLKFPNPKIMVMCEWPVLEVANSSVSNRGHVII